MLIGGLQKLTLVDYPGKVAATVFTCGCNFRCPFCHNPELVIPQEISRQPKISPEEVLGFLRERVGQLDGVCVTGGEPTIQDDLPDFIAKIKELGFLVKLDANGSRPAMLERLLVGGLLDYVAMDIKAPLDSLKQANGYHGFRACPTIPVMARNGAERNDEAISANIDVDCRVAPLRCAPRDDEDEGHGYDKLAGVAVDLDKIRKSVKMIMNSGVDYEFRTTVIKNFHAEKDLLSIAESLRRAKKYFLQPFSYRGKVVGAEFRGATSLSSEELRQIAEKCEQFVQKCEVRD